jgi:hypothetical protein
VFHETAPLTKAISAANFDKLANDVIVTGDIAAMAGCSCSGDT